MRTLPQPGPVQSPRILIEYSDAAMDYRIDLPEGADLLNGLRDAMTIRGVTAAGFAFLGGTLAQLEYFTGMPDPTGRRLATYGDPTPLDGPVTLIAGNAILGLNAAGKPLMHCHAVMADRDGRVHGGHLPPGSCRVGRGGVRAFAVAHEGAGFVVSDDVETNYAIFHPAGLPAAYLAGAAAE